MFDFNGTLADDLEIVYAGMASVFHKFGLKPPSRKIFRNSPMINQKWYHEQGIPRDITQMMVHEIFSATIHPLWGETRLRSDAITVVQQLRELRMVTGVVSALREPLFEERVHHLKIRGDFDFLIGGREDKRSTFLEMMEKLQVSPAQTFYVGDTASDVEAANLAGIVSIAFASGYNSRKLLVAQKPDFVVKSLTELLRIVG